MSTLYVSSPRRVMLARSAQSRRGPGPVQFDVIRRARRPRVSERSRVQGVLVAPSRVKSVGVTQGAFAAVATGVTFPTSDGLGINWWIDVTVTDTDPASVPGDPFTVALTAARRHPVWSVVADWDHDGYGSPYSVLTEVISSITVERSAVGDLPDTVSLVEGTTVAQATLTLEGRFGNLTVFEALAAYRSDSPLYRAPVVTTPVVIDLGFLTSSGPQLFQQLVGHVRAVKPDSQTRTVELTVLDTADQIRAPITLPAYGMNRDDYLVNNHKFYVNTQAIIDYALRKNGIYASVAPHPDAQISCTGHGWLAAETGRNAVPRNPAGVITDDSWWVPGPFDLLAVRGVWSNNSAYTEFFAREPYTPVAGTGIGMSAWIRFGNDLGLVPSDNRVLFQLLPLNDNTAIQFNMRMYGDGGLGGYISVNGVETGFVQTIATPTTWLYVGLFFQHYNDGTTEISYRQNGVTSYGDLPTPTFTSPVAPFLQCTAWTNVAWSDFQCWYAPESPGDDVWPGETPLLEADIGVGLNRMTHLPDVVNADSWELISDVTAAEYGLVGLSESGRFFFQSRDATTVAETSVEETITADRDLMELVTETSSDSVRNIVTTETTAGFLDFQNIVYESQVAAQFDTPTGVSVYSIVLPYSAIGSSTQKIPQQPNSGWGTGVLWGYVAVQANNPTVEITTVSVDDLQVLFTMTGDRAGRLTVRNNTGFTVRFATTSGQPALRVQGWLLEPTPTAVEYNGSQGSVDTYGPRVLAVGASPWRQLLPAMRPVALRLLAQLSWPVPVIDQFTALGNPARKVGDTIRLVDPKGQGVIRSTLVKLSRSLTSQGLVDTLTVRPVGPPGVLILNDPELGVLDDPGLWLTQ